MFLEIKGIKKSFGTGDSRVNVLKGFDLEIERGEFCVLLGPSGSGKSTLLKAGMGLLGKEGQLCRGKILYDGTDLGQCSEREMQKIRGRELGMVFQIWISQLRKLPRISCWTSMHAK